MRSVVFIVTGLNPHGAELMLYKLVTGIDRSRFSPIVIALGDRQKLAEHIEALDVAVHCLGAKGIWSGTKATVQLHELLRKYNPDVIQGWMYHGNLAGQIGRRVLSIRASMILGIRQSLGELSRERPLTRQVIRVDAWLSRTAGSIV